MRKLDSSKYIWVAALAAFLVVAIALTTFSRDNTPVTKPPCGIYRKDKIVTISSQDLNAEVATTPAQREVGLGGRPCILPEQAMLFVFDKAGSYSIWMKDMNFPIDIAWISADHKVVGLERDVKPSTYPDKFVNKDSPAQYVLELKANRAADLHLTIGTTVQF